MTIEITEKLVGLWFVQMNETTDWLASLNKSEGDGCEITYRFRYYNSPEPFDDKDRKNWYSFKVKDDVQRCIEHMRTVTKMLVEKSGGKQWELLRGAGSVDNFMDEFSKLPFVHMRVDGVGAGVTTKGGAQ